MMERDPGLEPAAIDDVIFGAVNRAGEDNRNVAPMALPQSGRHYHSGDQTLYGTALGWRMVNPLMPDQWAISLGASTERLVAIHNMIRNLRRW